MKILSRFFPVLFGLMIGMVSVQAQDVQRDSTGLPGDNFSLQGALDLFSKADNLEAFEKSINEEKNNVNNLDLNGDGQIDYIRVIDRQDGNAHAIVLQAVLGKDENQDIAVIEIEKKDNDNAIAQIVGDEDIYGKEVYVEANPDNTSIDDNGNQIKKGPAAYGPANYARIYFNVWYWPCVQYIYAPVYVVYVSPWYWHTYPLWWNPWRPWHWHTFYYGGWHYHNHFVVVNHPRVYGARAVYAPHRVVSNNVQIRNEQVIKDYRSRNNINIDRNDSRHRGMNNNDTPVTRDNQGSRNRQGAVNMDRNGTPATRSDRNATDRPGRDGVDRSNNSGQPAKVDRPRDNGSVTPSRDQQPVSRENKPATRPESNTPTNPSMTQPQRQSTPQRVQRAERPANMQNNGGQRQTPRSSAPGRGSQPSSRRG